jgi:hypothetical protein
LRTTPGLVADGAEPIELQLVPSLATFGRPFGALAKHRLK